MAVRLLLAIASTLCGAPSNELPCGPKPLVTHKDTAAHLLVRSSVPFTVLPSCFALHFLPNLLTSLLKAITFPQLSLQPSLSKLVVVPWPSREVSQSLSLSPSGSVWESSFHIQASKSHESCNVIHVFPSQSTKMLIPQNHFLPGFLQHHQIMLNLSRRIQVIIQAPLCPRGSLSSLFILHVTS